MVSKQLTTLSFLIPIAMSIGTLISIYAYNSSRYGLSMIMIVGMVGLSYLLFNTYAKSKSRS